MSVLRLIIRKTWTYQDTINHLQDFGHIKADRSIIRTTWAYQDSNNHRKSLAYPYSYYHSQDLGISIKTRSIIHKSWVCHRVLVRYIIHLYCLAVQVGFYSDVVECSTLDRRVPDSILNQGLEILRVRDRCVSHSQDLGMSGLRSIVHKTWAYQDSSKSSQVIGISVLRLIIHKTWTYQLRHDQSFVRLGLIKIPTNHSQDFGISRLLSIVHKTWAYQDSDQHLQDLGISKHMPIMSWICQSCQ